jgi:hypothetical protein
LKAVVAVGRTGEPQRLCLQAQILHGQAEAGQVVKYVSDKVLPYLCSTYTKLISLEVAYPACKLTITSAENDDVVRVPTESGPRQRFHCRTPQVVTL